MSFVVNDPEDIAVIVEVLHAYVSDDNGTLDDFLDGASMAPNLTDAERERGFAHRRRAARLYINALDAKATT